MSMNGTHQPKIIVWCMWTVPEYSSMGCRQCMSQTPASTAASDGGFAWVSLHRAQIEVSYKELRTQKRGYGQEVSHSERRRLYLNCTFVSEEKNVSWQSPIVSEVICAPDRITYLAAQTRPGSCRASQTSWRSRSARTAWGTQRDSHGRCSCGFCWQRPVWWQVRGSGLGAVQLLAIKFNFVSLTLQKMSPLCCPRPNIYKDKTQKNVTVSQWQLLDFAVLTIKITAFVFDYKHTWSKRVFAVDKWTRSNIAVSSPSFSKHAGHVQRNRVWK